jgi:uncharacterized protein (TIGR03067 family)
VDDDLARLQGRWRQIAGEADGVASIGDEYGAVGALVTTFTGTHFVVHHDDGRVVLEGDFEIDLSAHTIDWIDSIGPDVGKRLPAIYRLDDDRWRATSLVHHDRGSGVAQLRSVEITEHFLGRGGAMRTVTVVVRTPD